MATAADKKARIGVLGASGYTGAELVRLLIRHPRAELALLTADRRAGQEMRQVFPQFAPFDLPRLQSIEGMDWAAAGLDLIFCALPHATTQKVIQQISRSCLRSGSSTSRPTSGSPTRPPMRAGTGTSITRPSCSGRRCTAWSRSIARRSGTRSSSPIPAATPPAPSSRSFRCCEAKTIDPDEIVIDAKSGMTGAGRAAKEEMLFSEVSEGFHAYGVGHHRHMAELDQEFSLAAGREVVVSFTPHLVPMNRGIFSTIYVRGLKRSAEDQHAVLQETYAQEPFVHLLPFGQMPQSRHVRGSNMTFIGVAKDRIDGRAIIVSTLDNLTKGASGQAVQNMNLMLGFPETMGLEQVALFP